MRNIFFILFLISSISFADTPPASTIWIKGATDNTPIGNVTDSIKVNVTNSITATVTGPIAVTQSTSPWIVGGTVTVNAGTGTFTVGQSNGSNLHVDVDNFPSITETTIAGLLSVGNTVLDYATSNVTTSAYTTLISSTPDIINQVNIFDSSGQTLYLSYATACADLASTANTILIFPGGSGLVSWEIPSGKCVGVEAQSATASAGALNITYLQ